MPTPPINAESHAASRFYVEIGGVTQAVFTEVSGLQVDMETFDYAEGGNNGNIHRLPGRVKVSNVVLKRGITKSNDFLKWYLKSLAGKVDRRTVTVKLMDSKKNELVAWVFEGAYPVKWSGPQMTADGTAVAIETLELAHRGLKIG
jgi:phage tail-like protein